MDKKVKWGIVILVGAGLIGWGIYSRLPKANEELAAADKVMTGKQINKRVLNVNAKIIKPQLLTDQIQISGSLMPDEEVDLSFETSGKIVEINFDEGTTVKKGQLLAKVNDRQLQAQLQRLVAQLKLAEDRVFRQNALLERDAVSKDHADLVTGFCHCCADFLQNAAHAVHIRNIRAVSQCRLSGDQNGRRQNRQHGVFRPLHCHFPVKRSFAPDPD